MFVFDIAPAELRDHVEVLLDEALVDDLSGQLPARETCESQSALVSYSVDHGVKAIGTDHDPVFVQILAGRILGVCKGFQIHFFASTIYGQENT